MAKDARVNEDLAQKFASEKDTPYLAWVRSQGLDIIPANYVPDLRTVELKPWAARGGKGIFINHDALPRFQRLLCSGNRARRQDGAPSAAV